MQRALWFAVMIAALILCQLASQRRSNAAPPVKSDADASQTESIMVRILDADGKPIRDAVVTISGRTSEGRLYQVIAPSDAAKAEYNVPLKPGLLFFSVTARAPNYVAMRATWQKSELEANEIEKKLDFAMERAITISGHVRDEVGKGIEGAKVSLLVAQSPKLREQDAGKRIKMYLRNYPIKTDKKGRWECNMMADDAADVWLKFTCEGYISDDRFGETTNNVSIEQLQEGTLVSVLKMGTTLLGIVTDSKGNLVAGAEVFQGSDRFGSDYPRTKTDQKGVFRFPGARQGEMILTTYKKGYAPQLSTVDVKPRMRPVKIQLDKGDKLTVKVVDGKGNPLDGVWVAADTWREHRSLVDLRNNTRTDQNGIYEWDDAPSDSVSYDILKKGYMDKRGVVLAPRAESHVVCLSRPLVISGKVTDATTGKPITSFSTVPGFQFSGGSIGWEPSDTKSHDDGKYEITIGYPRPKHFIRFDAVGYTSARSISFDPDDESVNFNVKLQPAKPVMGTVVDFDGRPILQANVALNTVGNYASVENGRMSDLRDVTYVTTKADGKFQLPTPAEDFVLLAVADAGMVVTSRDKFADDNLTLRPWATVSGIVQIDGKPARQLEIGWQLDGQGDDDKPRFRFDGNAHTDDKGNYRFPRVIPGAAITVYWREYDQAGELLHSGQEQVTTIAGKGHELNFSAP